MSRNVLTKQGHGLKLDTGGSFSLVINRICNGRFRSRRCESGFGRQFFFAQNSKLALRHQALVGELNLAASRFGAWTEGPARKSHGRGPLLVSSRVVAAAVAAAPGLAGRRSTLPPAIMVLRPQFFCPPSPLVADALTAAGFGAEPEDIGLGAPPPRDRRALCCRLQLP